VGGLARIKLEDTRSYRDEQSGKLTNFTRGAMMTQEFVVESIHEFVQKTL
jgi:hypothetical protein